MDRQTLKQQARRLITFGVLLILAIMVAAFFAYTTGNYFLLLAHGVLLAIAGFHLAINIRTFRNLR